MPDIAIPTTYKCSECSYTTASPGKCRACAMGRNASRTVRDVDLDPTQEELITQYVATDEDLASMEVYVKDENGQVVLEQQGVRYELQVDEQTGEVSSIPVPVMVPVVRLPTEDELAALKEQRDRSVD